MKKIVIDGGTKLRGSIIISGSKNASLPILASSILFNNKITLKNVPRVRDIFTMIKLLETLGKKISFNKNQLEIYPKKTNNFFADYKLVKTMRAGILVLGPLLAKFKKAKVSLPGGCAIGARPVDLHINFLDQAGYENNIFKGYVVSKLKKNIKNISHKFKQISVGATETAILNTCCSNKKVVLKNIAIEPEILDLINFLNKAGARIKFLSKRSILIEGVSKLNSTEYKIMPDRIEAGTYLIAGAIAKGEIQLKNINLKDIKNIIQILKKANVKIKSLSNSSVQVSSKKIKNINVATDAYPGFPTDMQAQLMSLLCFANGKSKLKEKIFENRFLHVLELQRMGANIQIKNRSAIVTGVKNLSGAEVMATDLRASVCLVLAGLASKGRTIINRIYHLERGYENLVGKLKKCGAKIKLINA
jgi:UDP-N-acetylglucosamine 1-carboxyvinyltransferase